MKNEKLIHQLFIGKVSDELGIEKTTKLLKEARDVIEPKNMKLTEREIKIVTRALCDYFCTEGELLEEIIGELGVNEKGLIDKIKRHTGKTLKQIQIT